MVISSLILYISFCQTTHPQIYDVKNASKVFNFWVGKYDRKYKTYQEREKAKKNFVDALNKINDLNEKQHKDVLYVPNGYADVDVRELDDIYGVKVIPYYDAKKPNEANDPRNTETFDASQTMLYDLRKTDELYESFMKKYKKKNVTKEKIRMAHYYKFLKTLVEQNRYNFENNDNESIDKTADIIEEANEYFY